MSDTHAKRTYQQDTLTIPGLRLEPTETTHPNSRPGEKRSSRYDELEKPEREKLVNKLIDRLKGL